MSEVDTAKVRAESTTESCLAQGCPDCTTIAALCDALDAAREDAEDLATIVERMGEPVINTYRFEDVKRFMDAEERAEKAEAERDAWHADSEMWRGVAVASEAKVAAVRAALDSPASCGMPGTAEGCYVGDLLTKVRAALGDADV